MNYAGSTCICRVPKAHLKDGIVVECTHCGKLTNPPRAAHPDELARRPTQSHILNVSSHSIRLPRMLLERLGRAGRARRRLYAWAEEGASGAVV